MIKVGGVLLAYVGLLLLLEGCAVEVPPEVTAPGLWKTAVVFQFAYSTAGLLVGALCVLGGMVLYLHGVTGSTSWVAKLLGVETSMSDAAPGAVLFVIGWLIIWVTRFRVRIKGRDE